MNCFVNEKGKLVDIPQVKREAEIGEFMVTLNGYYETLNEKRYPDAIWDFDKKCWTGVGEPNPIPVKYPVSEEEKAMDLLKVIAFNIMNNDELLKTLGIQPRESV